jgi:hypothetical protein
VVGGGREGPVIIPHPDDDDVGHLLNNVGSTNVNNDNSNNAPLPPLRRTVTPCGGKGAGTMTVPDDIMMVAVASKDAVATNATNTVGHRGACNLHVAADDMGGFMIMCLILFDCRVGSGCDGGLDGGEGAGRRRTIAQQ